MNNLLTDIRNIKITTVNVTPISIPLLKPFSNHLRIVDASDGLICWVHTNMGTSGQGLVYGLGKFDRKTALEYANTIASKIINQPIISPKRIWNSMCTIALPASFELHNVISAIDIAIWDIYLNSSSGF